MINKEKDTIWGLREMAEEAEIFYRNALCDKEHVERYFPRGPQEKNYARRPKIALPIASSIIDRIINFLSKDMRITIEGVDTITQDFYLYEYDLQSRLIDTFTSALIYGNVASVIYADPMYNGRKTLQSWDTRWIRITPAGLIIEWETSEEGEIEPIDDLPESDDIVTTTLIDDTVYAINGIITEHNLGFAPYNIFKSPTFWYCDPKYGVPYTYNIQKLIVEYNQVFSSISKDLKILKSVWKTNRIENPDMPISMDPERINYLGENGTLEQVLREINISPEMTYLTQLMEKISEASKVPSILNSLDNVGKIPSGIALGLMLQPLKELVQKLKPIYFKTAEQLVYKLLVAETGNKAIKVTITGNSYIIPGEREARLSEIVLLKEKGLIAEDLAKELVLGLI